MRNVLKEINEKKSARRKVMAVLVDPDKTDGTYLRSYVEEVELMLVGGSTGTDCTETIRTLRQQTLAPIVLFPGKSQQFTKDADAILYLSVLSSRNAEILVGEQIRAARKVMESGIEVIPMGYILIDGGAKTAVCQQTQSMPIAQEDIEQIVDTAIAAELMGKKVVYLEAGSGARRRVSNEIITAVRNVINIPLIVGGGIVTPKEMREVFDAGADIVVIGNHFEQHPEEIPTFIQTYKK